MPQEKAPIWNRNFTLLWAANFLMATAFYFLLPTVPPFSTDVLGADKGQVGYLIGIYTISALAIRPLAGYLLDVVGRRVTYLVGLALFALFMFAYGWAPSFALLLVIRFLQGLGWGTLTTGGSTVAADLLPPARRGEGLGYYGLTMSLAMAFGPLLATQLLGDGQYRRIFLIAGGVATAALLMALLIRYPRVAPAGRKLSFDSFIDRKTLPISTINLLTMITYGGIMSFITLFATERGLNSGLFFLFYAAALSLSRPFAGRIQDKHGPNVILGTGIVALAAGFFVLSAAHSLSALIVASVLLGLGNGNVGPTLQAMALGLVAPARRGVASSTLFSATDLGIGLGSTVMGWVADATSLGTMFTVSGFLLALPLAVFYLYVRRYYSSELAKLREGRPA
ncbi:MAG: putative arabinose efflux permease, family [Symbiobacteriaceae bacterium]|nr:putative arabinose efflux permease, family [Symbiobacteriaceae bacterium]